MNGSRVRAARLVASSLLVGALAAAALGCGSGDDKNAGRSQGSEAAEAKAQYIAKGDAVCDTYRTTQDKVLPDLEKAGKAGDAAGLAKAVRTMTEASQKAYEDFSAIPKPSGDEAVLNRYTRVQQKLTRILNRAADAYERGDAQQGTAILSSNPGLAGQARAIARRYGFRVCGSG
jgi:hypothetical protein